MRLKKQKSLSLTIFLTCDGRNTNHWRYKIHVTERTSTNDDTHYIWQKKRQPMTTHITYDRRNGIQWQHTLHMTEETSTNDDTHYMPEETSTNNDISCMWRGKRQPITICLHEEQKLITHTSWGAKTNNTHTHTHHERRNNIQVLKTELKIINKKECLTITYDM